MIKSVVLDLDDTLTNLYNELFEESVPILNYLKSLGLSLYIASHNASAEKILEEQGIKHYFSGFSCGVKTTSNKLGNLAELPVERETTVFFDDYEPHVITGRAQGWKFIKVKPSGVSWENIESVFNEPTTHFKKNEDLRRIQL
jgi:FMN phosphatase YigB (HAD superfamily)